MTQRQRIGSYNVCVDAHDRVLLVRLSAMTPVPGRWSLPGGEIEFGEHPEAAALRELHEETGLTGEIVELVGVDSYRAAQRQTAGTPGVGDYHAVRIFYRTKVFDGPLTYEVGGSSDGAAWCTRAELEGRMLSPTAEFGLRFAWPD